MPRLCIRNDKGDVTKIRLWRHDEYADKVFPSFRSSDKTDGNRYMYLYMDSDPRILIRLSYRHKLVVRDSKGREWFVPLCDQDIKIEKATVDGVPDGNQLNVDWGAYGGYTSVYWRAQSYVFGARTVSAWIDSTHLCAYNGFPAFYTVWEGARV